MRILVVEDDERILNLLEKTLAEDGHSIAVARAGQDALDMIRVGSFDVMVLDVMLPQLTGFAVVQQMRREGNHSAVLFLTARDALTDLVKGLNLGADGEELVAAPGSRVYVANADTSEIDTFNPTTLHVEQRWTLGEGKEPHGLAFDGEHHRLFAACRNQRMIVINSDTGAIVTTLPIGETVDMAAFDEKRHLVFASNGDGKLSMFHQLSADKYQDVGPVTTGPNAKQMDFDSRTGQIFLPSGDILTAESSAGKPVHTVKEGSFFILVVGRKPS